MSWDIITPAVSAVVVAVIEAFAARDRKRTARRAERRERESRLSMEMMDATVSLSLVIAKKVNGQHVNGDVEAAMQKAVSARGEYEDFIRDEAAHAVAKL